MKELIHNHAARFMVYLALAVLSLTTLYGSFFLTQTYHQVIKNKLAIEQIDRRMLEREITAAKYVPMLEGMKGIVDQHSDLLKRIMTRQRDINNIIEKPIVKKKK